IFMIAVEVNTVAFSNNGFVIFLKEQKGERTLPIFVGILEARSIAGQLNNEKFPRPLTHDLFKNVLDQVDCKLIRVEVCDLIDNTFFGKLVLEQKGNSLEIDSRPSDAIALALRFSAPVYVEEKVMDEASEVITEENVEKSSSGKGTEKPKLSKMDRLKQDLDKAINEERYEDAARLRDEINELSQQTDSN
ncbi:MAG: hypothetical protein GF350_07550, partial [Chitinivibrionales bacterium]|nr:hypothetical protein [Chitinivibrionales bacterium]